MDIYRKICVEIFSDLNDIRTNKTELLINYETELKRAHITQAFPLDSCTRTWIFIVVVV